jgi:type I restriction enzyme M protein
MWHRVLKHVSFIWSIADDCLRDIYVRGKYRDVILSMVILRRLDSLLEPTKEKVLGKSLAQNQESEPLFTLRWSVV